MNKRDARIGFLFASPYLIGFCLFMAYPMIASFCYAFTSFSVLRPPKYIGLDNFRELLVDKVFFQSLGNTLIYVIASVPLGAVTAIILALLLNAKVKGMAFYRTIFFLPSLLPMVASATLFQWIFNGDYGILNAVLKLVNIEGPNWMANPAWTKPTLVILAMWGCGQAMVIYLAGLQDVPVSLYEAAELDGAKAWAQTRHVTLPMISPVILFNVVMSMIGAVQVFAVPYVMYGGGGPGRSAYMFGVYVYETAMQDQRMGYASAMGWVMFAITLTLSLVSIKLSDRHVHYEGA